MTVENSQPTASQALFQRQVEGLLIGLRSNELPPRGLAGELDWRFEGQISQFLKKGFIQGRAGECIYLPVLRAETTYHLILFGLGDTPIKSLPKDSLKTLQNNIQKMGIKKFGISKKDFGDSLTQIESLFSDKNQEGEVWMLP